MSDDQVVREYVVRKVTLIIDNTESLLLPVRERALSAVQDGMGSGWGRDDFVMMLGGRGQVGREEVAEVVGLHVVDVIGEWLDLNDPLHVMLADLLDLRDAWQMVMFGEHFMPEADDWPEE